MNEFEIYLAEVSDYLNGAEFDADAVAYIRSCYRDAMPGADAADAVCDYLSGESSDEDDGQPSEYTEWQDYFGGDDWDHGQFDEGF